MPVTHSADGRDVGAVDGRQRRVRRRESLQVPVRGAVGCLEAVVRQEGQARAFEAGSENDNVCVDNFVLAGTAFGNTGLATVDVNAVLREALNVAADPVGLAVAELLHNVRVDHGGVGEEALVGGRDGLEVAVEELAEERFGDPGKGCLLAPDVHREECVDNEVARDDPLVGARENGDLRGTLGDAELEGFDGRSAAADDGELLALGVDTVPV